MSLEFIEVARDDFKKIEAIYTILKKSGEHLFHTKGLTHWRTPYSKEQIRIDASESKVYIVKNTEENKYVHTFQLTIQKDNIWKSEQDIAWLSKFATAPFFEGKGIGSSSIEFIEELCKSHNIKNLGLDVYDKSLDAIRFYKTKGFVVVGNKKTKYFNVLIMKKNII